MPRRGARRAGLEERGAPSDCDCCGAAGLAGCGAVTAFPVCLRSLQAANEAGMRASRYASPLDSDSGSPAAGSAQPTAGMAEARRGAEPSRLAPKGAPRRLAPDPDLMQCTRVSAAAQPCEPGLALSRASRLAPRASRVSLSNVDKLFSGCRIQSWSTLRVAPPIRRNCCSQLFSNSASRFERLGDCAHQLEN